MPENKAKKSYLLLVLSIPLFFFLSITTLYFIKMDVWVLGTGQITPVDECNSYLPENAQLQELKAKPGGFVKKGDVLAKFTSIELEIEQINLQNESIKIQDEIKFKQISRNLLSITLDEKSEKANQLQVEKSDQEILSLKNKLSSNEKLQDSLNKRINSLTILAPDDGIIIDSPLKYNGCFLTKGSPLFIISKNNERRIEMSFSEKNIIYIKQDSKVRFAPNTYSVFEFDYFWGNVVQVIPQAKISIEKNTLNQYTVYSDIKLFGKSPISKEISSKIPYGSSGKCAVSIGKKSLLLQLIGWN